jgi:hypothetical protein
MKVTWLATVVPHSPVRSITNTTHVGRCSTDAIVNRSMALRSCHAQVAHQARRGFAHEARQRKWALKGNERRRANFRGVRVALGASYKPDRRA